MQWKCNGTSLENIRYYTNIIRVIFVMHNKYKRISYETFHKKSLNKPILIPYFGLIQNAMQVYQTTENQLIMSEGIRQCTVGEDV